MKPVGVNLHVLNALKSARTGLTLRDRFMAKSTAALTAGFIGSRKPGDPWQLRDPGGEDGGQWIEMDVGQPIKWLSKEHGGKWLHGKAANFLPVEGKYGLMEVAYVEDMDGKKYPHQDVDTKETQFDFIEAKAYLANKAGETPAPDPVEVKAHINSDPLGMEHLRRPDDPAGGSRATTERMPSRGDRETMPDDLPDKLLYDRSNGPDGNYGTHWSQPHLDLLKSMRDNGDPDGKLTGAVRTHMNSRQKAWVLGRTRDSIETRETLDGYNPDGTLRDPEEKLGGIEPGGSPNPGHSNPSNKSTYNPSAPPGALFQDNLTPDQQKQLEDAEPGAEYNAVLERLKAEAGWVAPVSKKAKTSAPAPAAAVGGYAPRVATPASTKGEPPTQPIPPVVSDPATPRRGRPPTPGSSFVKRPSQRPAEAYSPKDAARSADVAKRYENGQSQSQIARDLGLTQGRVSQMLKQHRTQAGKPTHSEVIAERNASIVKSRMAGQTLDQIASAHGMTREGVRLIIQKDGTASQAKIIKQKTGPKPKLQ